MKDVVAIDIETTGLNPEVHGITQIALVRGQLADFLKGYVKPIKNYIIMPPKCEINDYAAKITGFTREKWANRGAVSFEKIHKELLEDIADATPLGWNPAFDKGFITHTLRHECGGAIPHWDYHLIDVSNFALPLLMRGEIQSLSMSAVGPYVGVSNEGEHDAVVDVRRTLEILPRLWPGGIGNL